MIWKMRKFEIIIILTLVVIIGGGLYWWNKDNSLEAGSVGETTLSPTQVKSIEAIGQWEFLSINDEELVDTTRHGFFGDDHLVRIYYGTLRLGIDMRDVKEGWLKADKDSITCTLPDIKLLDNNFIDETRTRSFIETGKWTHHDRKAMYNRAVQRMRRRCLTKKNYQSARDNARVQFEQMLRSMGYDKVRVE